MADYFKITLEEGEGVYVELQNVFDAEVSYNGGDWEEAFDIYFENEGDYALVRAEMPDGWGANEAKLKINEEFSNIGTFSIEGNIMSLICGSQIEEMTDEEIAELEIPEYCFKGIFKAEEGAESRILDASGLVLPTLTLANNCYEEMFAEQNIEHLPELPATTLADYCYSGMFRGCGLQDESKVPELPAMQLAPYCYYEMFARSYLNGSDVILPATTLAENCYQNMFSDANQLMSVEIKGTTLAGDCFYEMFMGIENFYYITASMTSQQLASGTYTNDWMLDATPHIYTTTDPNFDTSITRGPSTIPEGCGIVVPQPAIHFKELFINGKQVKTLAINGKEVKIQAAPFPTDRLVAHFDAIDNTLSGHSDTTTQWDNLVEGQTMKALVRGTSSPNFESNAAVFNAQSTDEVFYAKDADNTDVSLSSAVSQDGEMTFHISWYYNTATVRNYCGLIGKEGNYGCKNLYIPLDSGTQGVRMSTTEWQSQFQIDISGALVPNAFNTITVVVTSPTFKVYVNGTYVDQQTADADLYIEMPFCVGGGMQSNQTSRVLIGKVHDLFIYSKALTEQDIVKLNEYSQQRFNFTGTTLVVQGPATVSFSGQAQTSTTQTTINY